MQIRIKIWMQQKGLYMILSFLFPIVVLGIVYRMKGIYLGSTEHTILASDSYYQYSNFFSQFARDLREGNSLFYTWNGSLGLNYWTLIAYYLGGGFSPLAIFFTPAQMPDFLYCLTLLKIGMMGLSFWYYSVETFHIPKWANLQLSLAYSLMSYMLAYSEIIMWMDALIYLPLIILGINRVFEKRRPMLLFISYLFLFLSNFYIAFMVAIFTFLYFVLHLIVNWRTNKKQTFMYLWTALTAGLSSFIVLLPVFFDLHKNGEAFSSIHRLITRYTGVWDLIVKNMAGIYDSTKTESSPYIYVGILAVILTTFFFVNWKVTKQQKIILGTLLLILAISFYIEPLNLLWQGMHTPNMFNFRYSFLFSFTVLMAAGYGWSVLENDDFEQILNIGIGLMGIYLLTYFFTFLGNYSYVSFKSFVLTLALVCVYLFFLYLYCVQKQYMFLIAGFFLFFGIIDAGFNCYQIISGISYEWHYPARKYYVENDRDLYKFTNETKKLENQSFFRMENINGKTMNDSFKYDYHGVNLFSSIRNRHSSSYLNALGYRSTGTNLKINYNNNTLLMDYLLGIRYNIMKNEPNKYGYHKIDSGEDYQLYQNDYAMSLGCLTDNGIYNDNLFESQTVLINYLSKTNRDLFTFSQLELVDQENVKIKENKINNTNIITYEQLSEKDPEVTLKWRVAVPARQQAYLSLYPKDNYKIRTASVSLEVDGKTSTSSIIDTGQFYNLGYYEKAQFVDVKVTFYNLGKKGEHKNKKSDLSFVEPDVALLNVDNMEKAIKEIQKKEVQFIVKNSQVKASVDLNHKQVLFTTIPYDESWHAMIDHKKVKIRPFKNAFLTLEIPKGRHTIQLKFVPQGFYMGCICSLLGISGFGSYLVILRKIKNTVKRQDP